MVKATDAYDAQLKPLGDLALARLGAKAGESIIDTGCGAAQICLQIADAVGKTGAVLGVDLSPALVDFATARACGVPQIEILKADAGTVAFKPNTYDAVFSRFGVMAFADPVMAFSNLRSALRPEGRLAFVCWRHFEENELDYLPFRAVARHLPPERVKAIADAYPFSFAAADSIQAVLGVAGFCGIECSAHDMSVCAGDLDRTLALCLSVGALGQIIRNAPALRSKVITPVRKALAAKESAQGLYMNAAVWVVTAKAS